MVYAYERLATRALLLAGAAATRHCPSSATSATASDDRSHGRGRGDLARGDREAGSLGVGVRRGGRLLHRGIKERLRLVDDDLIG